MMDATALIQAIQSREMSASEAVANALHQAKTTTSLGAFLSLQEETALEQASQLDGDGGQAASGRLAGLPIAVKDNITQANAPCGCGSQMLSGFTSPTSATALDRLVTAGAIPIGRTNMDEFGMGSSGEHSAWPRRTAP